MPNHYDEENVVLPIKCPTKVLEHSVTRRQSTLQIRFISKHKIFSSKIPVAENPELLRVALPIFHFLLNCFAEKESGVFLVLWIGFEKFANFLNCLF